MNGDDFPVSRVSLLIPAADALADDWMSFGGPFERLGPGAVDFRHQLALVRDDDELLALFLKGIGLYTHDDVHRPDERPVWFVLDRTQERPAIAAHEVAVAQAALEEALRRHRDVIRPHGDGGAGLERAIRVDRIRANSALREKVLTALEFYSGTLKIRGEPRTVWFRWQPGDPPTAFTPTSERP